MESRGSFYITTTLPYVNASPHMGHALEFVMADVIARYQRMVGYDVFFNTGTDEHGIKIFRKAQEEGVDPHVFVDRYAAVFRDLLQKLGIGPHNFIRTTDPHHVSAAQEFWRVCAKNGFIKKKRQRIKYCSGCEMEKTDSELREGHCPEHPHIEIDTLDEENYFFLLSRLESKLKDLYLSRPDFVLPERRFNEVKKFIEGGVHDFSISRIREKMPWGVPVPGDDEHVMYVWFDALVNYISAIGWPDRKEEFDKWWPVVQVAGKDQLRPQVVMWQGMLLAAGLPPSRQILIHGFYNSGGQKMSKSLGNVIDPYALLNHYGTDAVRCYIVREGSLYEDSDITYEKFNEAYHAHLANGLGNVISRVMRMVEKYVTGQIQYVKDPSDDRATFYESAYHKSMSNFDINRAAFLVWEWISEIDRAIQHSRPFEVYKTNPQEAEKMVKSFAGALYRISFLVEPLLPDTAVTMRTLLQKQSMPPAPLFPRKSSL